MINLTNIGPWMDNLPKITEQCILRGGIPVPVGVTVAHLRVDGFAIPWWVAPDAIIVPDAKSPTGYVLENWRWTSAWPRSRRWTFTAGASQNIEVTMHVVKTVEIP